MLCVPPKDDKFSVYFETRKMGLHCSDLCFFCMHVWEYSAGHTVIVLLIVRTTYRQYLLQPPCTRDNNMFVIDSQQQFVDLETLGWQKTIDLSSDCQSKGYLGRWKKPLFSPEQKSKISVTGSYGWYIWLHRCWRFDISRSFPIIW